MDEPLEEEVPDGDEAPVWEHEIEPLPGRAPARLDRYLADRLPELSRSRIQALMREGAIEVDGKPANARQAAVPGQRVEVRLSDEAPRELEAEPVPFPVLFEDETLLVIDKPEGLCVHPAPGNWSGTLVHGLLHHCGDSLRGVGDPARPGIVHRLDKETSGCLIVAKTPEAHGALTQSFSKRETEKIYLCAVERHVTTGEGSIENFLGRNPGNRKKIAVLDSSQGRRAVTDYEVLHRGEEGYSLVSCRIHTGRTHQIRVHMASTLGHAIIGDTIYGRGTLKRWKPSRLMLHARRLGLHHPVSGEWLTWTAPVPAEFQSFLPPGWPMEA